MYVALILLALACTALGAVVTPSTSSAGPIHLPIAAHHTRRNHPDVEVRNAWMREQHTQVSAKYDRFLDKDKRDLARADIPVTLHSRDTLYSIPLSIGTPPQELRFTIDTGSTDLIVRTKCNDPAYSTEACAAAPMFKTRNSSTFMTNGASYSMTYGRGGANGTKGADIVKIGDYAVNMSIGLAEHTEDFTEDGSTGLSGVVGFGWPAQSAANHRNMDSLWSRVFADNPGLEPMFALYTERADVPIPEHSYLVGKIKQGGGVLTIGGTDKSKYTGDITWIDSPSKFTWTIPLDRLSINANPVDLGSMNKALIDSGTGSILGPLNLVDEFYKSVPGAEQWPGFPGQYRFPCKVVDTINVSLTFGDFTVNLGADLAAYESTPAGKTEPYCYGAVMGSKAYETNQLYNWVLGDVFFKNVYSVFRAEPPAVGFATLASKHDVPVDPTDLRPINDSSNLYSTSKAFDATDANQTDTDPNDSRLRDSTAGRAIDIATTAVLLCLCVLTALHF